MRPLTIGSEVEAPHRTPDRTPSAAERGLTIVMTTHEPAHALEIGDRPVLLYGAGRFEAGTVADMCAPERLSTLCSIGMPRPDHADG